MLQGFSDCLTFEILLVPAEFNVKLTLAFWYSRNNDGAEKIRISNVQQILKFLSIYGSDLLNKISNIQYDCPCS